jgi:hypothetical protein
MEQLKPVLNYYKVRPHLQTSTDSKLRSEAVTLPSLSPIQQTALLHQFYSKWGAYTGIDTIKIMMQEGNKDVAAELVHLAKVHMERCLKCRSIQHR